MLFIILTLVLLNFPFDIRRLGDMRYQTKPVPNLYVPFYARGLSLYVDSVSLSYLNV